MGLTEPSAPGGLPRGLREPETPGAEPYCCPTCWTEART